MVLKKGAFSSTVQDIISKFNYLHFLFSHNCNTIGLCDFSYPSFVYLCLVVLFMQLMPVYIPNQQLS